MRREVVLASLKSPVPEVRLFGIRMANEKGLLSLSLGCELIENDRSQKVRIVVARCLVAAGESVDLKLFDRAADKRDDDLAVGATYEDKRAVEAQICLRLPERSYAQDPLGPKSVGPSFYEALGLRDEKWMKLNVRRDLRDNFTTFREQERTQIHVFAVADAETAAGQRFTNEEREPLLERSITPGNPGSMAARPLTS